MRQEPNFPRHTGGGELWTPPEPPDPPTYPLWVRVMAHPSTAWIAIAACFFFVGLTFWLEPR